MIKRHFANVAMLLVLLYTGLAGFHKCKLLVDNVEKARDALKELDVMFWEEKVLLVRAPDRQGLLLSLLERLSEGGVNLKDGYASASSGEEVLIVLSVSNTEQALSILSTASCLV